MSIQLPGFPQQPRFASSHCYINTNPVFSILMSLPHVYAAPMLQVHLRAASSLILSRDNVFSSAIEDAPEAVDDKKCVASCDIHEFR